MATLSRQAFARLMEQVEELEDAFDDSETKLKAAIEAGDADQIAAAEKTLNDAREALRERRGELARLSDGCGHGHHH
ncbi:MAG: hypothetical protein HN904_14335 [Victivallales bacterium]|jgi:hypothetical protein|nr:hypothetical protein [Victivallales bacterium]MBT7163956.1 hypothetical protein [Victivallales bacterium]